MRFLSIILLVSFSAFAADVSFEGSLEADYANYLETDFAVNNKANQDLRLKMLVDFDENFRVIVGAASKSRFWSSKDSSWLDSRMRHRFEGTDMDSDERWSQFIFDGISLEWTFLRGLTFVFGDLSYSAGSFNYYYWRNPDYYAAIISTQTMRGLGVHLGKSGYVYVGASDANNKSGRIAAGYAVEIPGLDQVNNKFVLTPMFDFSKGGGREHNFTVGLDANYSRSYTDFNYVVRAIWGLHPTKDDEYINTFAIEPSFNYKDFSFAALGYWALLADDTKNTGTLPIDQTYAPDKALVYIEPSYSITKQFSAGLVGEWHHPGASRNNWFFIAPTGYAHPTPGVELAFWIGYAIKEINYSTEGKGDSNFSFGISSSVNF